MIATIEFETHFFDPWVNARSFKVYFLNKDIDYFDLEGTEKGK